MSTSASNGNLENRAGQILDRATTKAHETVDRVAASVTPVVERVTAAADGTSATLQSKAKEIVHARDQWLEDIRIHVRERPLTTLGLTAIGVYLLGRLTNR